MKISIVVFDGVDEIDFIAPWEVMRRAAKLVPNLEVKLATVAPAAEITAANGLRFLVDEVLDDATELLIVPGGGWSAGATRSIRREVEAGVLPARIATLHAMGATVAGVCTGAMAMAAGGILNDRPAITHASAVEDLRASGARVCQARVVDDGDVVTCGGVCAGLDLSLWLVERLWGAETAKRIAAGIEYTPIRDVRQSHAKSATR